jgi:hypothetical protein
MQNSERGQQQPYEIHRVEEETGFKPNQLVVHKITQVRGRVKGYFTENGKRVLVVRSTDMSDVAADVLDKWEKIAD